MAGLAASILSSCAPAPPAEEPIKYFAKSCDVGDHPVRSGKTDSGLIACGGGSSTSSPSTPVQQAGQQIVQAGQTAGGAIQDAGNQLGQTAEIIKNFKEAGINCLNGNNTVANCKSVISKVEGIEGKPLKREEKDGIYQFFRNECGKKYGATSPNCTWLND